MVGREYQIVFGGHSPIGIAVTKTLSEKNLVVHVTRSNDEFLREQFDTFPNVVIEHWDTFSNYVESPDSELPKFFSQDERVTNLVFSQRFRTQGFWIQEGMFVEVFFPIKLIEKMRLQNAFSCPANIIFLTSPAANLLLKDQPLGYHISKAALNQVIRFFANNLAPNVKVNGIAPGSYVLKDRNSEYFKSNEQLKKALREHLAVWKVPDVNAIAKLVKFLVSDENLVINGQIIDLSGGYLNIEPSQLLNNILN